jgi:hypothetical protein
MEYRRRVMLSRVKSFPQTPKLCRIVDQQVAVLFASRDTFVSTVTPAALVQPGNCTRTCPRRPASLRGDDPRS